MSWWATPFTCFERYYSTHGWELCNIGAIFLSLKSPPPLFSIYGWFGGGVGGGLGGGVDGGLGDGLMVKRATTKGEINGEDGYVKI